MRQFAAEHKRCALWADLGLGKTPTTLQAICDSLHDSYDTSRWLVVAPRLVALDAWPRQLARWDQFKHLTYRNITSKDFGLKADIDAETGKRKGLTFGARADKATAKRRLQAMGEDLHMVSWDMLPYLAEVYGKNWPYDGLVLDEAVFASSSTSDRHKAAYHVIHNLKAVNRVIELTAKPTPNGYEQLHGQMRLLEPDLLGKTQTEFRDRYMSPITMGSFQKWVMRKGSREAIDGLLGAFCVSLKGSDYLTLPPVFQNRLEVLLPDSARELYDRLERDLVADIGDAEILAPSQAALAGKLMQVANGAVYDTDKDWHPVHNAKLERLDEVMQTVSSPILLAYTFDHDWQRIKKHYRHAVHIKDPGALDKFRAGKVKLLCMHPASGAHGVDGLQEASSTAVWFGATYNADHWMQFNARLHRDGQKSDRVVIHQILASDTIEGYVADEVLTGKIEEQDALLRALKMRLSLRPSR